MVGALFRRWWFPTLLVILACGVMVRLGLWQLDRLELRREFNARVLSQQAQPPLELFGDALLKNLEEMEYRSVKLTGTYLYEDEVALRNQVRGNQPGVHLVTPLLIAGSDQAVLVDRGWIPAEQAAPAQWAAFRETGLVEVRGVIRRSSTRPDIGRRSDPLPGPGDGPLRVWNLLNVDRIADQSTISLLPVYVLESAEPGKLSPPYPQDLELDLSEGPHLGYAGQWFMFAAILAIGYPFYIHRQESARASAASEEPQYDRDWPPQTSANFVVPGTRASEENLAHD